MYMLESGGLNKCLPVIEQDHMSYAGIDCSVDGKCVVVSVTLILSLRYCICVYSHVRLVDTFSYGL